MFLFPALVLVTSLSVIATPFIEEAKRANNRFKQSVMALSSDLNEWRDSIRSLPESDVTIADVVPVVLNVGPVLVSAHQAIAEAKNSNFALDDDPTESEAVAQYLSEVLASITESIAAKKNVLDTYLVDGSSRHIVVIVKSYLQNLETTLMSRHIPPPDYVRNGFRATNDLFNSILAHL